MTERLVERLRLQADYCRAAGSPLTADVLSGVPGATAAEHGELAQDPLLFGAQQAPRVVQHGPQAAMPRRQRGSGTAEPEETALQLASNLRAGEHAYPPRRELDPERQPVHKPADLDDGWPVRR